MYRKLLICFVWLIGSGFYAFREHHPKVFLIGDSTVATFTERYAPMAGWGQKFQQFFSDKITVDNRAIAGKSSRSFIEEGKWSRVLNDIRQGDYLLIQFGHNDQKHDHRYTEPYGTYKKFLTQYIRETRSKGGIPILVTSVMRRRFNRDSELFDTHGHYPKAVQQLANELDVPLIDLHQRSFAHFAQLGEEATKNIFLWLKPGESKNYPRGLEDNTHFSGYGAQEVGKLVIEGLKALDLPLKSYLKGAKPCKQEITESIAICQGDSVYLDGRYQTQPGVYRVDLGTEDLCQKTRVVTLAVHPTSATSQTVALCAGERMVLGGKLRSTPGTYYDMYRNRLGCDSVVTTRLLIHPLQETHKKLSICQGDSVRIGNHFRTTAGKYRHVYKNRQGCDSIVTTTLRVIPSPTKTPLTVTLCEGDSLLVGGSYQKEGGVFYDTLTSSLGCDSIVATTLVIADPIALPAIMAHQDTLRSSVVGDAYQWFFNGQILDTTAILVARQEGNYSVTVRVGMCTSSSADAYYYKPIVTGTYAVPVDEERLRVYQSEAGSYMYVVSSRPTHSAKLYIHDLLGNRIFERAIHDQIPLRAKIAFTQPEGIYIITLMEPNKKTSVKFYWHP